MNSLPTLLNTVIKHDRKSFLLKVFNTLHPNTPFADNWHINLIMQYLNAVEQGQIKRLLINIPPRSLKSMCINVAWPAWLLAQDPTMRIISVSYSQAISSKHSSDCRTILHAPWYKDIFPNTIILKGADTKNKFMTTSGGFRFATSIGGTLTGEGAEIIIVDDPHTPTQAISNTQRHKAIKWFEQTLSSRLNDKRNGSIVVVMQRLHVNDLSGHLLELGGWAHLKLPALSEVLEEINFNNFSYIRQPGEPLHKNREGIKELTNIKRELGKQAFIAQYQQTPQLLNSSIIDFAWIQRYNLELEAEKKNEEIKYQSWDCSIKATASNDYSVCTTWTIHNGSYYLIDIFRERLEYPQLRHAVMNLAKTFNATCVLIEDKASGQQLIQELQSSFSFPIIKILPKYDKLTRFILTSPIFEGKKVFFPISASWLTTLESELKLFPHTNHDDQVDSITQFLSWIQSRNFGYLGTNVAPLARRL